MSPNPPRRGRALVTGASSGIGAVYADRLARRGMDLVLVARDRPRLEAVAAAARQAHAVQVDTMTADLAQRADLRRVEAHLRADPDLNLMVNCAGFGTRQPLLDADPDDLESSMLALNVTAALRLATAAAQTFSPRGRGGIILIASIALLLPSRTDPVYAAAKAFVATLAESLHAQLAPRGVQVQCVVPGATRTGFFERAGIDLDARFAPETVMSAEDLVDAAMAGWDQGEVMTIPSLPDTAPWQRLVAARDEMAPNLSRREPAARYGLRRQGD